MSFHHFIKHGGLLKTVKRTGWLRYLPSEKVESVCDHSYRVGLISILLLDQPNIDSGRCVQIALLHDLAESLVGDITPMCKVSKEEKQRREIEAMQDITKELPINIKDKIMELWYEYENGSTEEGKIVKDIDKYEMMFQAMEYEQNNDVNLEEFMSARQSIKSKFFSDLADELIERRKNKNF